jgi:hypothetical protein
LVREGGNEIDFLVCKWLDPCTGNDEHADQRVLAKKRNAEHRASTGQLRCFPVGEFWVLQHIGDVDCTTLRCHTAAYRAAVRGRGLSENEFLRILRKTARRDHLKDVVLPAEHGRMVGVAKARIYERVEDSLELDG